MSAIPVAELQPSPLRNGYLPDTPSVYRLEGRLARMWSCIDLQREAEYVIDQHTSLRRRQAMAVYLSVSRLRCSCNESCVEAIRCAGEAMKAELDLREASGSEDAVTLPADLALRREHGANATREGNLLMKYVDDFLLPLSDAKIREDL